MPFSQQVIWLFVLAIPIACISWTVTHEEVFREFQEAMARHSAEAHGILARKFFYLFTCEYCFSHYVTAFFLIITGYQLLYQDWRGYLIAFFSLPFVANFYIGFFGQVKLGYKRGRVEIRSIAEEAELKSLEKEIKQVAREDASARRPAA
jgi:hypothetical protein